MKRLTTLVISALFLLSFSTLQAQKYSDLDKEGLRSFLRQNSSNSAVLNLQCLGLSIADTTNWEISEDWLNTIQEPKSHTYIDWEWDNSLPSRLTRFEIKAFESEGDKLAGNLDCGNFTELKFLDVSNSKLTSIDVSGNFELADLNCSGNLLTEINTQFNTALGALNCSNNKITLLDVAGNTNLGALDCSKNGLSELNIATNTKIKSLNCADNQIASLTLAQSDSLLSLDCSNNKVTNIELANYSKLTFLTCANNTLSSIDLSQNINLESLYCGNNKIEELDLSHNPQLELAYLPDNKLSSLNMTQNTLLKYLYCANNTLSSVNLIQNKDLEIFHCSNNTLSNIDLSQNKNLTHLYCSDNKFNELLLDENKKLYTLDCSNNTIADLNLSQNTDLALLYASNNLLPIIDLQTAPNLKVLHCANNLLSELDLSLNGNLLDLDCSYNKLTALTLSSTSDIYTSLVCNNNQLRISTLPAELLLPSLANSIYAPQEIIDGGNVNAKDTIDLSKEFSREGNETTYQWSTVGTDEFTISDLGGGKFSATIVNQTVPLLCNMENALFPQLTLQYEVKIVSSVGIKPNEDDAKNVIVHFNDRTNELSIQSLSEEIRNVLVLDVSSKKIADANNIMQLQHTMQLSNTPTGVYIVNVTLASGKNVVKKIRKK